MIWIKIERERDRRQMDDGRMVPNEMGVRMLIVVRMFRVILKAESFPVGEL